MRQVEKRSVWVVAERRRLDNRWQPERWRVAAVRPGRPETPVGSVLASGPDWTQYYMGHAEITLFPNETANYLFNLNSARPALYVILRRGGPLGMRLLEVTVDPGEIDIHADSGSDLIEALPLPPDLAVWMEGFIAAHHVERPYYKRRRDRADPEILARRPPMPGGPR
ncbi:DUF3305 domain-containing protein [Telmatospirillum sp. J64-1]|uniref:DUF3305 domain-containing protein n=1 Tax=Telmatospirillum sp. J64-1 TaxID=2502183 RepID=UPI00115D4C5A|nr:DUF3305 domain-containing protein [Telmatospirillum sp. J64-1]